MTPTARTLQECRKRQWLADVVERWIPVTNHPGGGIRKDLFGFVDVVAIGDGHLIGIQATTVGNQSKRIEKICDECNEAARAWLMVGGFIEVWGWKKYKRSINRKFWRPRIVAIKQAHLEMSDVGRSTIFQRILSARNIIESPTGDDATSDASLKGFDGDATT